MPRGRCHFACLHRLHERLRAERPDAALLADRHLPDFVAGSAAPDGLRYVGRLGKFATHFYSEDRKETWGQAVAGLFRAHPDLADPGRLAGRDVALLMGYISHLSVDEAFRDTVTWQLHGRAGWRPVVVGLWSIVDELPVGYEDLPTQLDRFERQGRLGFIDRAVLGEYLDRIRGWATAPDAWSVETVFLELMHSEQPIEAARKEWQANRLAAGAYIDDDRIGQFVTRATGLGLRDVAGFLDGRFAQTG